MKKKVKYVRALQGRRRVRQRERRFVFEGVRLVEEAVRAGVPPAFVLYTEALFVFEGVRLIEEAVRAGVPPAFVLYTEALEADERGGKAAGDAPWDGRPLLRRERAGDEGLLRHGDPPGHRGRTSHP